MITFKQFLSEQEEVKVGDMLRKDCGPYLNELRYAGFLRRGVKGLSGSEAHFAVDDKGDELIYSIKTVRQDRRPKDTTSERSKIYDDWFFEKFGIRGRSQCVFAAGEEMRMADLSAYGTPCVIFPIGPIKYVWSPHVEDLTMDIDVYKGERSDEEFKALCIKWLEDHGYQDTGMNRAVHMQHEVMIKCDSYYAFPLEYETQLKRALGF